MADTKIKDATAKTTTADSDELPINDVAGGNLDRKITRADLIGSASFSMEASSHITLIDNDELRLGSGTGGDSVLKYDGTDTVLNLTNVGTGDLVINGGSAEFDDNEGITLGTGKDATLQYDGTDLVVNPKAVGSGNLKLSGNIDMDGNNITLDSDADLSLDLGTDDVIILNETSQAAEFRFRRDLSSPVAGNAGFITFYDDDSTGTPTKFVEITGASETITDGAEDGGLDFQVRVNNSMASFIKFTGANDRITVSKNMLFSGATLQLNANNISTDTTTGTKIGTGTSQKLGFWNATPIAQPSSTGETVGFTAGAGTGVNDDSTFTGNVGSTAYRISDIVKHLKNEGLIAS